MRCQALPVPAQDCTDLCSADSWGDPLLEEGCAYLEIFEAAEVYARSGSPADGQLLEHAVIRASLVTGEELQVLRELAMRAVARARQRLLGN